LWIIISVALERLSVNWPSILWSQRWKWAYVLGFTNLAPQSCRSYTLFRQVLLVANQILVCILLTLRIYALYGTNLKILGYMVGSGAVLAIIACWSLFGQKSAPAEQASGCHIGLSRTTAIRLATAWEALFIYDSIIFGFTLYKTWSSRRDHHITRIHVPLISLILRDGAIYFAVMALANLANILTFYLSGPFMKGGLSTFASSISVTMMSRLMLNLHETADIGIFSTNVSTRVEYTDTSQYASDIVELDTLWSGALEPQASLNAQTMRLTRTEAGGCFGGGTIEEVPPILLQNR